MKIFLLRHGEAQLRGRGIPDAKRQLIENGRRDVERVVAFAKRGGVKVKRIVTSPLPRARQTADLAAAAFADVPLSESRTLLPAASPADTWTDVAKEDSPVMLVGHEPHLSHFAAFLLGSDAHIAIKKGALLRVDAEHPGAGELRWMVTPKLVR